LDLVEKLPLPVKKAEEYLKTIPGYKPPPKPKTETEEPVSVEAVKREPKIKQPTFT